MSQTQNSKTSVIEILTKARSLGLNLDEETVLWAKGTDGKYRTRKTKDAELTPKTLKHLLENTSEYCQTCLNNATQTGGGELRYKIGLLADIIRCEKGQEAYSSALEYARGLRSIIAGRYPQYQEGSLTQWKTLMVGTFKKRYNQLLAEQKTELRDEMEHHLAKEIISKRDRDGRQGNKNAHQEYQTTAEDIFQQSRVSNSRIIVSLTSGEFISEDIYEELLICDLYPCEGEGEKLIELPLTFIDAVKGNRVCFVKEPLGKEKLEIALRLYKDGGEYWLLEEAIKAARAL